MQTVGVIGLGNMGQPVAERIARHGIDTVVYDKREAPLAALREIGAHVASSPADLASRCELICVLVNSEEQLMDVMRGGQDAGLLTCANRGTTIVIHSTVSPAVCRELAHRGRESGLVVIDAPLSGLETAARDGTLSLMVGGPASALEACRLVFSAYASNIFHVGDVGAGQTVKIINNLMTLVNANTAREALSLAAKAGIAPCKMLEVSRVSTSDSWALRNFDALNDVGDHYPGGRQAFQDVAAKDLKLAISLGKAYGVSLSSPDTALKSYREFFTRLWVA
ncbi:MAG: NAD(P)-dependent oxidoreductase [Pseudomonadota bacterium]